VLHATREVGRSLMVLREAVSGLCVRSGAVRRVSGLWRRQRQRGPILGLQVHARKMSDANGGDLPTLVEMQREACDKFAEQNLFWSKAPGSSDFDNRLSYGEFKSKVEVCSAALAERGVEKDSKVAIISRNTVDWAVAGFGAMALGAQVVPMYEQQGIKDWEYIINDSDAKVVLAGTKDILKQVKDLDGIGKRALGCFDSEVEADAPENFSSWLETAKEAEHTSTPEVSLDDIATLIYTSGTTGKPKGVMLSHRNISSNVLALRSRFGDDIYQAGKETHLSFLPWAHVYGQTLELHFPLYCGQQLALVDSNKDLLDDIAKVKPSVLVSVPTFFLKIFDGVHNSIENGSTVKRLIFEQALKAAENRREMLDADESSVPTKLAHRVADTLVLSQVREKFGGNLKLCITGGSALDKGVQEFFNDIGVVILEGYGLTETAPIVASEMWGLTEKQQQGLRPLDNVTVVICDKEGNPLPRGEKGEICVAGPNVMVGYHNLKDKTDEVLVEVELSADEDGKDGTVRVFKTGDMGKLTSDGELKILGREKEQFKLDNGKFVVPGPIEDAIRLSGLVDQVLVYGLNHSHTVALVLPNLKACKEELGSEDPSDADLKELILKEIKNIQDVKKYAIPQAVHILPQDEEFTIENGLLTPKHSLKRPTITEKYEDTLESLYEK